MKKIKHILCIALSFAFSVSYAQTGPVDNTFSDSKQITTNVALLDGPEDPTIQNDGKSNPYTRPVVSNTGNMLNPEIKVYPEPFAGIVFVDLSSCPDSKICLYFESGKCLKYQDCQNETSAIFNLKNEPKGLYFMEIVSMGKKVVKKIDLE
ncbi:MAG: hypothetical protein K0S53_2109 [Bacteroidetes bacterium]|jgi:hypothetical protein|nr:hypothetical protein [Bacteroidota bacterium]MDF2453303.1 hypothetical protein [Bacteroidota bacterium]